MEEEHEQIEMVKGRSTRAADEGNERGEDNLTGSCFAKKGAS
jgi:hypothetical protein